ncbi:MAG: hypothetical protein HY390_01185, partial [Deltaproteobacteria bacterium]|nr:hypothetical protein [Deltaproteobacteria bacterium]
MPSNNSLNILIVNPYGIGDVLFSTPLIHTVKSMYPKAHVTYLIGSRTFEILKNNPNIDEILIYQRDYFKSLSFFQKGIYLKNILAPLR